MGFQQWRFPLAVLHAGTPDTLLYYEMLSIMLSQSLIAEPEEDWQLPQRHGCHATW